MRIKGAAVRWSLLWCCVSLAVPMAQALAFPPGMVEPLRIAPEVALTTAAGGDFRLSQHRGEAVVLVFGYTRCSDVCPMTLGRLVQVRTRLGQAAERVRVVFVTLDPGRDTAARVLAYTRWFDPTFVGLTGTPKAVARVRDAYGVVAGRRTAPGTAEYLVDHSTFVFVVDPAGKLRFMFPGGVSVEQMIRGIAPLLQ